MKKHILLVTALASFCMLGACDYNEDNFPGYDEYDTIKDVRTDTITLADADYAAIAKLTKNKDLALSKDPEGETYANALKQLGTNKFFTDMILPEEFLPAYVADKYPYLSDNSKILVNYRYAQNLPEYLSQFSGATTHALTEEDYKTVWGDKANAKFITPSTLGKIPQLLKAANSGAKKNDIMMVEYAYSETEPSFGGGGGSDEPEPTTYDKISDILQVKSGTYTAKGEVIAVNAKSIIINDGTGSIRIYRGNLPSVSVGDVIEVAGEVEFKQELTRFRSKSTFKFLERKASFAYPTPKSIDASYFASYSNAPVIEYVTYEGTLTKSGTNYNVLIGNDAIQPGITDALYIDPTLEGKEVVVTGYLAGVSGSSTKYPNTFATSIVVKGTENKMAPIGAIKYAKAGTYTAQGIVSAIYTKGFMLTDGTGDILVYKNAAPTEKVGDVVTVSGTTSLRNGAMQFGNNGLAVNVIESGSKALEAMVPQQLTAAEFDALAATPRVAFASFTGTLSIKDSGNGFNYFNIAIEGAETEASLSYVDETKFDMSLNGKTVVVTGYLLDYNKGRVAVMMTSIADAATATTKAFAATRASVEPNAYTVYQFNGSAWAAYEPADESLDVVVMQPSDYAPTGYSSLSNPSEILPVFLKNAYPYVKAGDKKAVVYYYYADKKTSVAASEYTYDGTAWIETVNSAPASMMFMLANGKWIEAVEYYSNTFAGELHGDAQIVDIDLGGKDYVWSALATSAHIQASGYFQKNRVTESWLVTPIIDLSQAIAPKIVFEASASYLYGHDMKDIVKVNVSTDYVPNAEDGKSAVQAATWTELQFDIWPDSDKFIEMQTDMGEYKGKKIYVAFKFASTEECAPTFRLKNFAVKE